MRERFLPALNDHGITALSADHGALLIIDERFINLRLARAHHGAAWHWQEYHGFRWQSVATWPAVGAALMLAAHKGEALLRGQGLQLVLDLSAAE